MPAKRICPYFFPFKKLDFLNGWIRKTLEEHAISTNTKRATFIKQNPIRRPQKMTSQRIFMVYTNHIASRRLEGFLVNLCHPPAHSCRVCGAVHLNPRFKPSLNEPGKERQTVLLKI